jgi:thiamine transporter ThiT
MLITIAILSTIGMILSFIDHSSKGKIDVNLLFPAILTISLWEINLTLSILTIVFTIIVGFIRHITND